MKFYIWFICWFFGHTPYDIAAYRFGNIMEPMYISRCVRCNKSIIYEAEFNGWA